MKIRSIAISEQRLPLVRPFVISNSSINERRFLTLAFQSTDGTEGRGDIAPLAGFSAESYEQARAAINDSQPRLREINIRRTATELETLILELDSRLNLPPSVVFGIELALAEIASKLSGQTLATWYRNDAIDSVEVNAVVGIGDSESVLREKLSRAYRTFKLKAGASSINDEISRIERFRKILGNDVRLRLDANRAFSFDAAREFFARTSDYQIEYIEEPLKHSEVHLLPSLRREFAIPIAIDETLLERTAGLKDRSEEEFISAIKLNSFDIAIFKPSLMGSISRTLHWAEALRKARKEIVVTSALDSVHSVAAALHIACAARVTRACGLDTAALLTNSVETEDEVSFGSILSTGAVPGIGFVSGEAIKSREVNLFPSKIDLNRIAIRTADQDYSYSHALQMIRDCRSHFDDLNIHRDSTIAILAANSVDYITTLLVSAYHGVTVAVLNVRLSERELQNQLAQIDPAILLSDSRHLATARLLHQRTMMLENVCNSESSANGTQQGPLPLPACQPCCVVFTSGSSGEPKGVVLSIGNLYYSALGANEAFSLCSGDVWHLSLPLYHVGGLGIVFRCLIAGAAVFVDEKFDSGRVSALIDDGKITHLSLVPTMLESLMEARSWRVFPKSFKTILLGGAAPGQSILQKIHDMRLPVYSSYGLSEAASVVTAAFVPGSQGEQFTSGRPLRYRKVKLFDNGEIGIAGEVVATKYLNREVPLRDSEGWFHTGDVGQFDENGNLVVMGRIDDMMISGGENIFPRAIEDAAERIQAVQAAAVVPMTDPKWGQRPILFVELLAGGTATEESIRTEISTMIAKYKVPDQVIILPSLPRTAIGKIDKQRLIGLASNSRED